MTGGTDTAQLGLDAARRYLLERAREQGVALEVYAQREAATAIEAHGGEVSEFKLSTRQGVGLRALVAGAWGAAFTENLSRPALDRALERAVEHARLVAPEAGAALIAWGEPPSVDLYGEGLSGVTPEQKVQVALTLEQAARAHDPRVVGVPYLAYEDSVAELLVGNTEGLSREQRSLHALTYAAPLARDGEENRMSSDWQFTREFTALDPTQTALRAAEKSLALLGARPAPTGTFPVVISGECMASLLALFASMFSGRAAEEGRSPLSGCLGQAVGSALVTLRDDPTLPHGLRSRAFDAEGCPSAPLTLMDGGELRALFHNGQTAARAGQASTGHATRQGYQGVVGVGHSNFFLAPGQTPDDEVTAGVTGLLLTKVSGGHAGAQPITGDFSLQAEGFWLQGGARAYPLDVFTVAGNFTELLAQVEAVGQSLEWTWSGTGAPAVRVAGLAVAGGAPRD
ncbi:TldD/PmbA family protein [Deinococcus arcticus]|uniref:TldD/PmbA family protein n=1 Tax=Deinococcus arcticus TaxID=2136176 RepID=A0A2T3W4F8_9DEIO|nr:TldD/PmbA family protein [Deinococcus arcticus]PTA66643.1 TldD/PmbA family protein [Deinococcus arcticus]